MVRPIQAFSALLLILSTSTVAEATNQGRCRLQGQGIERCLILRTAPEMLPILAEQYGLTFVRQLDTTDPEAVVVEAPISEPREATLLALQQDPEVLDVEAVTLASLVVGDATPSLDLNQLASLDALSLDGVYSGEESTFYSSDPWNGFANQPAVSLIRLDLVRDPMVPETYGTGVVAVIDTGVDPGHPMLQGALVAGYDFLIGQDGVPSEWQALDSTTRDQTEQDLRQIADQSYASIVEGHGEATQINGSAEVITDQSYASIVEQSYASIVEQSYASIVESGSLPSAFGHGTMVAGLVRLVAPGARIMPLRAFGGDGTASTADVIEAIHFAVDHGADVINMSFSLDTESPELSRAITRAKQAGVVCVSSAGNLGTADLTYPAALDHVIGVASSDDLDRLSLFSNHGADLVTVGAPGEALISLYPGGLYAGGWGTSFSSALVSGAIALLHSVNGSDTLNTVTLAKADNALAASSDTPDLSVPAGAMGYGRLDVEEAFVHGLSNNGNGQ